MAIHERAVIGPDWRTERGQPACGVRPGQYASLRSQLFLTPGPSCLGGFARSVVSWAGSALALPAAPARRPACGCRAAGRGSPARAARTRAAPRGRCPVWIPISCSIETRSSVAMLPVAPAGTGQPPSSPKLDSKLSDAGLERREHVREALPARVVEVRGQLHPCSSDSRARAKNSRTWRGLAMPVVSPKPTSWAPASRRRAAISSTRSGGTWPS